MPLYVWTLKEFSCRVSVITCERVKTIWIALFNRSKEFICLAFLYFINAKTLTHVFLENGIHEIELPLIGR